MLTFYTVQCRKKHYPVKYAAPPEYRIQTFRGRFGDPGEASQEFQIALGGSCCFLSEHDFQGKTCALAQMRRDHKAKV